MKCIAVCQDELVIRTLEQVLFPGFDVQFIVESRPLARRLHEAGVRVLVGDPRRVDTFLRADISPSAVVLIEDNGRRRLRRIVEAARDAGGTLIYVLSTSASPKLADEVRAEVPEVTTLSFAGLLGEKLHEELGRSLTRARVQQYQRFFEDAERILILLHNDPDPDAMASGLALRNLLRRTKTTCILGALQPMTRPENLRMAHLLDIQVETIAPDTLGSFSRIATVDVQPHYFGGMLDHVDLVIDHHPEQPGYRATFKDIRADYGSTCTILTEHLRAVDVSISERTATAMLYAIKSDTLFFSRQANRSDLEAFTYLYPRADPTLIRKMEGAEITMERLQCVRQALDRGSLVGQVFCAYLGEVPREDFIVYAADFFLQLQETKWTIVAGRVHDTLTVSVRNLGYTRNAGEFVKRWFHDLGSAGGHRAMAKAVVPWARFVEKFGIEADEDVTRRLHDMAAAFLGEGQRSADGRKDAAREPKEPAKAG